MIGPIREAGIEEVWIKTRKLFYNLRYIMTSRFVQSRLVLKCTCINFANANAAFALAIAFDCHVMDAFALAFAFDSSAFAIALAFDSNAFD